MEKIITIHVGHDATVFYVDEKSFLGISEERVTRIKNFYGFPFQAIEEVFIRKSINWSKISKIIFTSTHLKNMNSYQLRRIFSGKSDDYSNEVSKLVRFDFIKSLIKKNYKSKNFDSIFREILKKFHYTGSIKYLDHHLCHIASSYAMFPVEDPLLLSLDGGGDGLNWTIYNKNGNRFELRAKSIPDNDGIHDSPADIYANTTKFLGFKRLRDEGKIMGLAAKGKAIHLKYFEEILKFENGQFRSKIGSQKNSSFISKFLKLFNFIFNGINYDLKQIRHMESFFIKKGFKTEDICSSLQTWSENIFLDFLKFYKKKLNIKNKSILLSGGFFANVVINQRIRESKLFENVYVTPNMGDGGLTLGGCYLESNDYLKKKYFKKVRKNVYFGPETKNLNLNKVLNDKKLVFKKKNIEEISSLVVEQLVNNKIIGIFYGRMEYGPRALGARSILANPSDDNINEILNKRLGRSEFMPFGPMIRDIDAKKILKDYNNKDISTYFMTTTYNVKKILQNKAPAIVHLDKTVRPQIINFDENRLCYKILDKFYQKTKIPALINTSFNSHEEPIIMNEIDAIKCLELNIIDFLVINECVIYKNNDDLT
jgi:carbamoyltransferase